MYCRNIIRLTQSMSSVRSSSFSTTNRDTGVTTLPKTQTSNIMNGRIVWLFHLLYSTGAALQMTGPSTYEARVGSIAQIPCTFTADILPADPRFFAVVWDLEGKQILKYDNIVTSTNPRYSLDIDQALNGIAHLTISNTFLSDGGIYTCSVTNSPVLREKEIKVKISGAALQMTGPSTYEARVGSIAQIPCTFTADILPADPRFFAVVWDLEGKQILKYDNIVTSTDPRYSLDIDQALNGIAHLTISNTFLSDGGIYTCSVTDSPILRVKEIKVKISGGALQMTGPSTYKARVGSIAHIPCNFTADNLPADPRYFTVFWYLEGKRILSYDKTVTSTNPRFSLDGDQALNGIADLIISNTLLSDGGIYKCSVNYSSFPMDREISMNVSARPLISILNKSVQRNTENNLTCMANGFFPNNINVTWYKDGEVLKNQLMGEPLQYDNGTYQVNSTVTITPNNDDRNKTFSCRIQHVSLQEPLQEDFQLLYEGVNNQEFQSESSLHVGIIIGIVIPVVITIIGIIAAVVLRKKICRKAPSNVNDTSPTSPEQRGGQQVKDNTQLEESQELLSTNEVAEENPSDASKNIKQTPTKPSWSTGKTGGKSLGSPEQHLPPKDLQVSPRSRQSFAEQPPNQSEESNTTITPAKRPKENPNTPHNRQLPEIGEITVPELIAGKKATLSCRICNYIPGEHKVSWHVKEKSTGDVIAANYDRKKHESIEKDKDSDDPNTHITYLALVPVEKSDEGSDFILRLDLPDSACPIERRTGPILVKVAEENPSDASKNIKQTPTKPSWSTGKTGGKSLGSPEQHLPPKDLQVSPRSRQSFAEQPPNQREESNTTITPAKRPKENPNTPHNLAEENPSDASKNIKQTPTNPSWSTGKTGGKSLGSPEQHLPPKDLQVSPRSRQSFAEQPPNQREESNTTITPAKRPKENPNTPHNRQLPEIGEITVPELIAGKKATLSCTIYNYIPGEHKVSWHVKLKSTGDVIGANYDGKKHQSIEKDIDSDDTYITYLALVPVEKSDEGSDFILRLDLPDSARPIERRTGPILVEERIRGKKKNKLCESIKEGKDQCTESPTTLAEDNKPQSSDQQQTCKPENETSKESSEEQPKCPVKVEKKDNTDTVLAL
ncbi:uncharacterized protein [Aquarana catesbeiana]|uniref:uncharacterized protein isoform X10 n=1 Tax=Aquarana catesbeiana TaxID=8400 RepID=UPI003CC9EB4C